MSTILIAAPEHLQVLKRRADFNDAEAFSDGEAVRALEVITRKRPAVVALERLFAASPRGAALIDRLKAEPNLSSCEIRIVAHDSDDVPAPATRPDSATARGTVPRAVGDVSTVAVLDQRGTRRAPRFPIVDGVVVRVDGNMATLIDLSVEGAQVVSPTVLKPNQRVRIALIEGEQPIRFSAAVAWASFESAKTGIQYRAGIKFVDAERGAVQRFCDAKRKS